MSNSTNFGNRNNIVSIRETLRFHMDMYESLSIQLNTIMTCMATTRRNIDLYSDMYYQNGGEYSTRLNMRNSNTNNHRYTNRRTNAVPNVNVNRNPYSEPTDSDPSAIRDILNTFLTPVPVRPTQRQIDDSTRTCVYSDIQNTINTSNSCSICQAEFQDIDLVMQIRRCGHIFHREELMSWFQTGGLGNGSVYCPMCRADIREPTTILNPSPITNTTSNSTPASNHSPVEPETPLTDADRITQFISTLISSAGGDMNRIQYDISNNQVLILESEVIFSNRNRNRNRSQEESDTDIE